MKYLLIPCGDGYAELLAKHKEELKPYYTFIANDYSLLKRLINKVSFTKFARNMACLILRPSF